MWAQIILGKSTKMITPSYVKLFGGFRVVMVLGKARRGIVRISISHRFLSELNVHSQSYG